MKCKSQQWTRLLLSMAISVIVASSVGHFTPATAYAQENVKKGFMICPQCGKKNEPSAKFCWNDGYLLSKPTPKAVESQAVPADVPAPEMSEKSDVPIGSISEQDLNLLIDRLARRLEANQAVRAGDPNEVGGLTRAELEILLRKTMKEERMSHQVTAEKRGNGFGTFLKFVGGFTLTMIMLGIIAA